MKKCCVLGEREKKGLVDCVNKLRETDVVVVRFIFLALKKKKGSSRLRQTTKQLMKSLEALLF